MEKKKKEVSEIRTLLENIKKISYIQPNEIPNIDLYMDQVTTFMDQHLEKTKRYSEDKLLTKTMINNYTKNDLLPSPVKKKYSKDHMVMLIFIYYLKNFLSITDIQSLVHPMTELFFDGKGEISLDEIYEEIYEIEKAQAGSVSRDILKKAKVAEETFADIKDDEQREYLRKYAYACLLSYDIYMKRQMLERLIDENFTERKVEKNEEK
ncbi:MAG: DUF1836 domain-containing protein [Lachnospiraceae bacterium]|nr:DUF1836 domain-containing protein [Lachnospiraceae bacterium]MBQ8038857.1 DUF1836 domain-containing protein [Lachnospiraceae bacterium]